MNLSNFGIGTPKIEPKVEQKAVVDEEVEESEDYEESDEGSEEIEPTTEKTLFKDTTPKKEKKEVSIKYEYEEFKEEYVDVNWIKECLASKTPFEFMIVGYCFNMKHKKSGLYIHNKYESEKEKTIAEMLKSGGGGYSIETSRIKEDLIEGWADKMRESKTPYHSQKGYCVRNVALKNMRVFFTPKAKSILGSFADEFTKKYDSIVEQNAIQEHIDKAVKINQLEIDNKKINDEGRIIEKRVGNLFDISVGYGYCNEKINFPFWITDKTPNELLEMIKQKRQQIKTNEAVIKQLETEIENIGEYDFAWDSHSYPIDEKWIQMYNTGEVKC